MEGFFRFGGLGEGISIGAGPKGRRTVGEILHRSSWRGRGEKQILLRSFKGDQSHLSDLRVVLMSSLSTLFSDLPGSARVWIHPAATPLSEDTQSALIERLEGFLDTWTSHQQEVSGRATVLYDRFLVVAGVRADGEDPSGCAIDDATHAVEEAASAAGVEWESSLHVLYRTADGDIAGVSRAAFQERAEAGTITTGTTVFDSSVTTLGALREGDFEQPAGRSWHAQAFSLSDPA